MGGLVTHAWFMSFVELLSFTAIADYLGTYSVVYIYAGLNLVGVIVGCIFLPETKGKTSEQIENDLVKKK